MPVLLPSIAPGYNCLLYIALEPPGLSHRLHDVSRGNLPVLQRPSVVRYAQTVLANRREEQKCRFCDLELPDWRPSMTPQACKPVTPYMRVSFGGKTYKVAVAPGPEGAKQFELEIRKLLRLPETQEFDVIFHCKAPGSGGSRFARGSAPASRCVLGIIIRKQQLHKMHTLACRRARTRPPKRVLGCTIRIWLQLNFSACVASARAASQRTAVHDVNMPALMILAATCR
jgi:hypothetical protein